MTNKERADRFLAAMGSQYGDDEFSDCVDILTDMLHYIDQTQMTPLTELLITSEAHFHAELAEELRIDE